MSQTFPIVPAGNAALVTLIVIAAVLGIILILIGSLFFSTRNVHFDVSADALTIRGDIYGRSIPLRDLDLERAAIRDIRGSPEYGLSWRTNGVGLPGYGSGWFRLKNGEKALIFVTSRERVLHIPTQQGYALMLSPAQPEQMLDALRAAR